jgi:ribosomal-protein-alanine N-acetyltransferase
MPQRRWMDAVVAEGPRTALAEVAAADGREFVAAALRSRRLHGRWAYPPTDTPTFRSYIERLTQGEDAGFLVRLLPDGDLAGFINVNNVIRGALQSAHLGYAAFSPHAGRGYMKEGLQLLFRHAFKTMGLHRLEASIQPDNGASLALARSVGMTREGFSPRYLYIGGRWRDHEHWALTVEQWGELRRR